MYKSKFLIAILFFQCFLFSQIEQDKQAVAGFNIKPNIKPRYISKKIDFTITKGDTIQIWTNSTDRFYRVFIDNKWGWIPKGQVALIEDNYSELKDSDIATELEENYKNNITLNEDVALDKNEPYKRDLPYDNISEDVLNTSNDLSYSFMEVIFFFMIVIGIIDYILASSLITGFFTLVGLFFIIPAFPFQSGITFVILLGIAFVLNEWEESPIKQYHSPPVPSYEINSYTKDEICEFLIEKSFRWDGRRCTMEYTYGSGTVWVIGSGIFGDKLIRANNLYKHELIDIYMSVFGEQEPPLGYNIREPISQRIKDQVWKRDEGSCVICGSNIDLEYDHIKPVSAGGKSTYRNLQLLCEFCNRSKGAKIE